VKGRQGGTVAGNAQKMNTAMGWEKNERRFCQSPYFVKEKDER